MLDNITIPVFKRIMLPIVLKTFFFLFRVIITDVQEMYITLSNLNYRGHVFVFWRSLCPFCRKNQAVAETVSTFSRSEHIETHMIADMEQSVQCCDWKTFIAQFFKPLNNISNFHNFLVDAGKPGNLLCNISENYSWNTLFVE